MKEYFISIIFMSFAAGLASFVSYPSAMEKCAKAAISLLVMFVVITPLLSLVGSIGDIDFDELKENIITEDGEGEYIKTAEKAFELGIKRLLSDKYGLSEDEVSVFIIGFDFEKMRAEKIKITLSGRAALSDYRSIEEYVEKNNLGECEVNISLGK